MHTICILLLDIIIYIYILVWILRGIILVFLFLWRFCGLMAEENVDLGEGESKFSN